MPAVKKQELTIDIGNNLLDAIGLILNSVEKENERHAVRRLRPGNEVKIAFGIDLSNICKEELKDGNNLRKSLT